MAISSTLLSALMSSGVTGLASLFGQHNQASSSASGPLAKLEAYIANPSANASSISAQAAILATLFASSNPAAAGTAAEIEANPTLLPTLLSTLVSEIGQQSSSILTSLAAAVHLSGASASTTLAS